MTALLIALALLQFGPRAPLAPAETLIEPETLRTIERNSVEGPPVRVIQGSDATAGEIAVVCGANCEPAEWAMKKLGPAVAAKQIPQPVRTIRIVTVESPQPTTRAAIFVGPAAGRYLQVVRGLWSTASIADEVIEIFAHHAAGVVETRAFERIGQPRWEASGIPITTIVPPA